MLQSVLQTCIEMFEARKYKNINVYDDNNEVYIEADKSDSSKIRCYILINVKLNKNLLKYYYGYFITNHIKHVIFVYSDIMTSSVSKLLEHINTIRIECFKMDDLYFNILKHELVPLHRKVDSSSHVQKGQYPVIKKTDAICKFYGFSSGDVIEITRKNGTIFYRVVK